MEPVEIEETVEETVECDDCNCKPYDLVRYRDIHQQPSVVYGSVCGTTEDGVIALLGEDEKLLFIAPLDAILSIERVS